jgi:hypothetical protein
MDSQPQPPRRVFQPDQDSDFVLHSRWLKQAHIKFSIDWGSNKLRSVDYQRRLKGWGANVTVHTLIAIQVGNRMYVYSTCEGAFLFYCDFNIDGERYDNPVWREQKIMLDEKHYEGMYWIEQPKS